MVIDYRGLEKRYSCVCVCVCYVTWGEGTCPVQ